MGEIIIVLNSMRFSDFFKICVETQHTTFREEISSRLQAYFFQNNRHYVMITYTVIKSRLTFKTLLVTGCTNKFNILTIVRCFHTVFMCFVFV
jgi:hypothetical protein